LDVGVELVEGGEAGVEFSAGVVDEGGFAGVGFEALEDGPVLLGEVRRVLLEGRVQAAGRFLVFHGILVIEESRGPLQEVRGRVGYLTLAFVDQCCFDQPNYAIVHSKDQRIKN
jgi:hypothetical protein